MPRGSLSARLKLSAHSHSDSPRYSVTSDAKFFLSPFPKAIASHHPYIQRPGHFSSRPHRFLNHTFAHHSLRCSTTMLTAASGEPISSVSVATIFTSTCFVDPANPPPYRYGE